MADKVILTPTKTYRQQANNKIYVTVTSDCVSSVVIYSLPRNGRSA
jgi:hypothetical protein